MHVVVWRLDLDDDVAVDAIAAQAKAEESRGAAGSPRRQLADDAVVGQTAQRFDAGRSGAPGAAEERRVHERLIERR